MKSECLRLLPETLKWAELKFVADQTGLNQLEEEAALLIQGVHF